MWLLLLAVLAVCAPPLFIDLGAHVSTHTMENVALATSQETWLRWHEGEIGAWLVTSNDLQPRVEKPPMLTWLDFLAWSDLTPQTTSPVELTYRARLVTAVLGLIMLGAIFWIGHTLGGIRAAVIATLAAGSMFFFQRQARTASYDIHFVTWATLAIAAAIWAMKSPAEHSVLSHRRSRWIAGWSIAGLAMACSVMSKNPLAFAIVLMPLVGAAALQPERWKSNLLGIAVAVIVALLPVLPWYVYVRTSIPGAAATLKVEFSQPRSTPQVFYYYLAVFGLVIPWTLWVIAGTVQPWDKKHAHERARLLIPWVWFMIIFVFFSIWNAKQQRYILPIVAPAALLCAQVITSHQRDADKGRRDRLAITLGTLIWSAVSVATVVFGMLLLNPQQLAGMSHGLFTADRFHQFSLPAAIAIAAVLGIIAISGFVWCRTWKPVQSAVALAMWALVITTVFWHIDTGEPQRAAEVERFKLAAEHVAAVTAGAPLRSLRTNNINESRKLNEEFRLYCGRLIRRLNWRELDDFAAQSSTPVYVLVQPEPETQQCLRDAGFRIIDDHVVVDNDDIEELWTHEGGKR